MECIKIRINENAPVRARGEIKISADPEMVWEVLADISRWPTWNREVQSAYLEGEVAEGSKFRWKAGPGTITSTFSGVDRPRLLAWTGKTLGIKAIHIWKLDSQDGETKVSTEESWEGFIVRIMRGRMQQMLQNSIDSGLWYLKAEVERKSAL